MYVLGMILWHGIKLAMTIFSKLFLKISRRPLHVLCFWVGLLVMIILVLLSHPGGQLETELTGAKGTEAYLVTEILKEEFGQRLGSSAAIMMSDPGQAEVLMSDLKNQFFQISETRLIKGKREHQWGLIGIAFNTDISLVEAQSLTKPIRAFIGQWEPGLASEILFTGSTAFQYDAKVESKKDSRRGELFALAISFVILILNFGALSSALLPILMGASSILCLNALVLIMGWSVNPVSRILTSLVGLALGIDYALFIVSRFRAELKIHPYSRALKVSIEQAGATILFSGLIMICSLSALLIPDVSLSRTVMFHLILVIVFSLLHALIILPSLLLLGKKVLDWPGGLSQWVRRVDSYPFWKRFSSHVVNHYKFYFVLSISLLGLMSWPVTHMKLWEPIQGIAPKHSESMLAYEQLIDDHWGGELMPVVLVARTNTSVFDPDYIDWLYQLEEQLSALPETYRIQSLVSGGGHLSEYQSLYSSMAAMRFLGVPEQFSQLVNTQNGSNLSLLYVFPRDTMDLKDTNAILSLARKFAKENPKHTLLTGGVVARVQDFTHELYRYTPLIIGFILLGVFLILWQHMGTVVLPIKAALMNFLPILGAFGVLTLIFQYGWGASILQTPQNGAVTNTVPLVLFCIVFGLSMDYEVLILSRISEAFYATGNVKESIIEGLAQSGSVISGAVLILLGVFIPGVFSSSPQTQEICIGIVAAILLDATIIRLFLVPSFMCLLGRWNWWKPEKKKH